MPDLQSIDPRVRSDMRNDCSEITTKKLSVDRLEESWGGEISIYWPDAPGSPTGSNRGWSPLGATTIEDLSSFSGSKHQVNGVRNPVCDDFMALFVSEGDNLLELDTAVRYELRLDHQVLDFQFPASLAAAPTSLAPIDVKTKTTLTLSFLRHPSDGGGGVEGDLWLPRDGDVQSWDLEPTCATPFRVAPSWVETNPVIDNPYCKTSNGKQVCLEYTFEYSADQCSFVLKDGAFKRANGSTVHANLGGYFAKHVDSNAADGGYDVHVTNIEIPGSSGR